MIDVRPFFSPGYWFDLQPVPVSDMMASGIAFFFFVLILLALAIRFFKSAKTEDKIMKRFWSGVASLSTTTGIIGFVWLVFHYERIRFLGGRFWLLFLALYVILRLVFLFRTKKIQQTTTANGTQKSPEQLIREKYLPKPKK